jgi:hypothetical protein
VPHPLQSSRPEAAITIKGVRHDATPDNTPVAGYDAVIADPHRALAERLGLTNGGRVVVRPDGYIGAITTLEDTKTVADYFADYFARIAS